MFGTILPKVHAPHTLNSLSLSLSLFFPFVVLPKITSMLPANRFSRKQRKKRGSSRLKLPRLGVIKQWSTSSFQNALLYAFKPILDPIFWRVYWWWMEKKLRNSQGSLWSSVWDHLCAGGWSRAATRPPLPQPPHFFTKEIPPFWASLHSSHQTAVSMELWLGKSSTYFFSLLHARLLHNALRAITSRCNAHDEGHFWYWLKTVAITPASAG